MAMTTLLTLAAMFGAVRQNTPRVGGGGGDGGGGEVHAKQNTPHTQVPSVDMVSWYNISWCRKSGSRSTENVVFFP